MALNVVIAVLAMLWLVPVFWLVVSSFRAEQGAYTSYLWPKSFTFGNYVRMTLKLLKFVTKVVIVAGAVTKNI